MSPAVASATAGDVASHGVGRATVRSVTGAVLGSVRFEVSNRKILVTGRLSGIAPGFHGFHVHAVGVCDPNSTDPNGVVVPFLTAGGHLNTGGTSHGAHAGDLPSLRVSADGTAVSVTENDQLNAAALFDADGSAIIIHALPDNFAHIPPRYAPAGPDATTLATGDAGGRIACGVVSRS
ncbi:superoxide dismutase family protein [Kibdelosporangium phytohabitans]|uniref:Superoxide dismutase [Cu-Zn] n=1 Tax=Kibdelosporangium phytohabitans TaxID=860235 RepID=A0A0N9HSG6_9PSEU|nr:superoxide dismutase family protein [Kibdelosporangium phytohabitans]ALG05714.1 hypothetical protein AOZ06_01140 [Kibdelosporangium phytohabitans]MBE1466296.1 Cu-Zn family superoxide dismutase [Kibdelosporangium phytohabitans]